MKRTTPSMDPDVNYGFQVTMMSQCRSSGAKNVPLQCYIRIVRKVAGVGIQEIFVFLFNYAANPKLFLKIVYFKRGVRISLEIKTRKMKGEDSSLLTIF